MSTFYSNKKELKKADKFCRRAESIIAKDLKSARNSSTSYDISRVNKLYDLSQQTAYSRKYLDNRLKAIKPSGMDNNQTIVKTKSTSVPGGRKQLTLEELNQQAMAIKALSKGSEHINYIKGNMIALCEKAVKMQFLEEEQVRRVVTGLENLTHLDSPLPHPDNSYMALLAEKIDGITFKDLGKMESLTEYQKKAIINYLPHIKTFVESSSQSSC